MLSVNTSNNNILYLVLVIVVCVLVSIMAMVVARRSRRSQDFNFSTAPQPLPIFQLTHNNYFKLQILDQGQSLIFLNDLPTTVQSDQSFKHVLHNYFEVKIVELDAQACLRVGIAQKDIVGCEIPGHSVFSLGYEASDGDVRINNFQSVSKNHQSKVVKYGEKLEVGDTLGLGYNALQQIVYFTKNSTVYRGLKFPLKPLRADLFPTIYCDRKCQLEINFGQDLIANPFVYPDANSWFERKLFNSSVQPPPYVSPPPI